MENDIKQRTSPHDDETKILRVQKQKYMPLIVSCPLSLNSLRAGSALSHTRAKRFGGDESGDEARRVSRLALSPARFSEFVLPKRRGPRALLNPNIHSIS